MKRRFAALSLLMLIWACTDQTLPTRPGDVPDATLRGPLADRYIVVYDGAVTDAAAVTTRLTEELGVSPDYVYEGGFQGFAAELRADQLDRLRTDPRVRFIEQDQVFTINQTQSPTPSWGLDRVDQVNLPLDNSYTFNTTGAGVTLYGIDTGIRTTHNDFTGRTGAGFTAINDGNGTNDCNGHGTHTASTAAGSTYGVAKGMTVVPVRVLDCGGSGTTSGVIAGIQWVTANAQLPAVANMSLGGGASAALDAAVAASVAAGVVYSVSAGNSNISACLASPAREPSAITVGATDINDRRASFSNFGTCVDLFAPGVNITAAWNAGNNASNTISGTSMSAPHVSGVAGLYLEQFPAATPAQVDSALGVNATTGVVQNPGSGSPNRLLYMGFIGGGPPPPPPPPPPTNQAPVAAFTWSCNGLTCTFDASSSTDDQGIVSYVWTAPNGKVIANGVTWTRTFNRPSTIKPVLTVTDAQGLSDSVQHTVSFGNVDQPPVASFTWSCDVQLNCTFDASGSTDDVGIVAYTWTDSTGAQLGTGQVLTLSFGAPTVFDMTLTVADSAAQTDSQTQTITVGNPNQPPVASFAWSCDAQMNCTFDASGSTDDNGIVAYTWTDQTGTQLGTGQVLVLSFSSFTTFDMTLTVADAQGLTDSQTQTVTVGTPNQPPTASFTWSCDAQMNCTFDASGSTDDNGIVAYTWTDQTGTQLGTGQVLTLSFSSATTFDMTLTVADAQGLTDSQTQTVTVGANQPPVAAFTWTCNASHTCTFDASGSTDDQGIVSYVWTAPNGKVIANGVTWTRTFNRGGVTINPTLTVTDGDGATDSVTHAVTIP